VNIYEDFSFVSFSLSRGFGSPAQ